MVVIFDMDDVIVNTKQTICDFYNYKYKNKSNYTKAEVENCKKWNFSDVCPLMTKEERNEIFENDLFFCGLTVNEGIEELIDKLRKDGHIIKLYTIGTPTNIHKKINWLTEMEMMNWFNGGLIFKTYSDNEPIMDKSEIGGIDSILIDDNESNLFNSGADFQICYAPYDTEYNSSWEGLFARNVQEIGYCIELIQKKGWML